MAPEQVPVPDETLVPGTRDDIEPDTSQQASGPEQTEQPSTVDFEKLFGGAEDGRRKPDYEAIDQVCRRLEELYNKPEISPEQMKNVIETLMRLTDGLFNRANKLDVERSYTPRRRFFIPRPPGM